MSLKDEALKYHIGGKIDIAPSKPMQSAYDLALAYSPGVAEACLWMYSKSVRASNGVSILAFLLNP